MESNRIKMKVSGLEKAMEEVKTELEQLKAEFAKLKANKSKKSQD